MKKALAVLVLLSVTLLPVNSHSQDDSKAPPNFDNLMLELGSLSQQFGKMCKNLGKIAQTLNQMAPKQQDLRKGFDATRISKLASLIKDIDSGCGLTSDILFVSSLAKEKYYSVLVNYLRQGVEYEKKLLEQTLSSIRQHDAYIIGIDALHEVNRAKDVVHQISKLYDETLALLPRRISG